MLMFKLVKSMKKDGKDVERERYMRGSDGTIFAKNLEPIAMF